MARMIDGDKLMELYKEQYLHHKSMKHGEAARAWQGAIQMLYDMPTLTQPNEPLTVTEVCPHCESEITMEWDVKTRGHKAVCPVCGNRLMLCDECQHGEPGHRCDYDSDTDTCRFNRRPPEGEEET